MKAVVLVGGEGTRLRPLTETIPKPLLPLVDRPFLHHVLDHLSRHGVEEAIMASSYLEEAFASFIGERRGPPTVTWVTERTPLDTAGAVANAARGVDGTFFVLNGDVLTDLDLGALLAGHREAGAVATISVAKVQDARPYGLVTLSQDGRVLEFREKPTEPIAGLVNAGTYVLEPAALRGVAAGRPVNIEREVFPRLVAEGIPVLGVVSRRYWMDVGTPEKYLQATFDVLEGRISGLSFVAPHVAPSADVSLRAHLGRWVVVGPEGEVGEQAEVEDSVLLARAKIGPRARVRDSIVGPDASVGEGALVQGAVLAEGAVIPAGSESEGARVGAGEVLRQGRSVRGRRPGTSPSDTG
jgi:mannose-1-phosphate guanylyltransferase